MESESEAEYTREIDLGPECDWCGDPIKSHEAMTELGHEKHDEHMIVHGEICAAELFQLGWEIA